MLTPALSPATLLANAVRPNWPAPANIHALVTTRLGGVSAVPFANFNVGDHVDDDAHAVACNRELLERGLQTIAPASAPQWLKQVHGVDMITPPTDAAERRLWVPEADAATTTQASVPLVIMTADCLPILMTDRAGQRIAAAHAGWRGLCDGIIEKTAAQFTDSSQVLAWLGPAIGPRAFEVGPEVRAAFMAQDANAELAFQCQGARAGYWMADIYQLARQRLQRAGISAIYGGEHCTWHESAQFFSYRRDGRTGRMASVIWIS
jgi:YfiH family protein